MEKISYSASRILFQVLHEHRLNRPVFADPESYLRLGQERYKSILSIGDPPEGIRDPQFGPCVMFGLGGIFTEILGNVTFRPAPLSDAAAGEMLADIRGSRLLSAVWGLEAADTPSLIRYLVAMGWIRKERDCQ